RNISEIVKPTNTKHSISLHLKRWWSIVPTCVWWAIWRERNLRCHENITNSIQKVKENCINMLFFWCKEDGIEEVEQLVDFLGSM
ncbi:hypothetical protein MTR67_049330, partial [Solanum verrucosum]